MGEIPDARDEHTADVFQNSMYVFGGFQNGMRCNSMMRYSFPESRWY
jgi:hypothetical protein